MSSEPSGIPRDTWGRQIEEIRRYQLREFPTFPHLEVTNPEILQAVKEELDYVWDLDPVKKSMEYAKQITLKLQKGEESKRSLLQNTPRIGIEIIRDTDGNVAEKIVTFRREAKHCKFIYSNTTDGEVMRVGENNLDGGYNEAIVGWVTSGIDLLKNAIEQDYYTPTTNVEITYSDTSTLPTEQSIPEDVKGPMEI